MQLPNASYFANPAEGDSMEPLIQSGDCLVFERKDQVESGRVGSFSLNGQYYCKRFRTYPDGSAWLYSDNQSYQPILIKPEDDFRVLGELKLKVSKI
jgi:phage repressor protein C with HTH and peptisase S24 domain